MEVGDQTLHLVTAAASASHAFVDEANLLGAEYLQPRRRECPSPSRCPRLDADHGDRALDDMDKPRKDPQEEVGKSAKLHLPHCEGYLRKVLSLRLRLR